MSSEKLNGNTSKLCGHVPHPNSRLKRLDRPYSVACEQREWTDRSRGPKVPHEVDVMAETRPRRVPSFSLHA
jgi:hypothetical protein